MSTGGLLRLFVGLRVSPAARGPLARRAARLAREDDALRLVAEEDLHLTLQFLGDVPADAVEALSAALHEVARQHAPLAVRYVGLGAFPDARAPRVVWAGVTCARAGALAALARDVGAALQPLGLPAETRPFSAHVTLARVHGGRSLAPETRAQLVRDAQPDPGIDLGSDCLSDLKLIVSSVGTGRYAYNDLTSHPLAAGAS